MSPGKFPTSLQSKYFELSEQIATLIAPTIEPFLNELIFTNQRYAFMHYVHKHFLIS